MLSRYLVVVVMLMCVSSAQAVLPLWDAKGEQMPSLAPMLKTVNPTVVNISTFTNQSVQNPLLNDPVFRHFFRIPPNQAMPQQQRRTQSAGSGVIIDAAAGLIVTNSHVVDGASEIVVGLKDGRSIKAEKIGADPEMDIAVLKIKADNLVALPLANKDNLEVGDFVIAIGNPFGLGQTVTSGLVSALGRTGLGIEGYENFIQTDASINPGNSGGALVNLRGELVGINTAIMAPNGGNVGIGFAIPINMAKTSIDQIVKHGEVKRGQLGIVIQDLTPELASAFAVNDGQSGVLIAQVQPQSSADKAGIKAGDVVISLDGKPIQTSAELRNQIGQKRIGDEIAVTILRDGKTQSIAALVSTPAPGTSTKPLHPLLGGAELRDNDRGEGVYVAAVNSESVAANSGLQEGDVIVSVNRQKTATVAELQKMVAANKGDKLLLRIIRGNMGLFVILRA
jgi:serine protease DegQ